MKSKYAFIVTAIVIVLVVGLFAALSSNSTATADSGSRQSVSASCPFAQTAAQQVSQGCCKSKCESVKKCDPNCKKEADPNCSKKCG